jgi:hypothetical protein
LQAILLREAFSLFALRGVAIKQSAPTVILDVSCGPGDYSVAWTSEIARFLPTGIAFYCTDYPVWPLGGILRRFLVGLVGVQWNSDIDNTVAQAITLQFKLIQYFLRRHQYFPQTTYIGHREIVRFSSFSPVYM